VNEPPVLAIEKLCVNYATGGGALRALDDVNLAVGAGETVALVGESGSGKSSVALAVMGLLDPGTRLSGSITFMGRTISDCSAKELQAIRGAAMSIIFQDPFTALNPGLPIGTQVAEPLIFHRSMRPAQARERAIIALAEVGLPGPEGMLGLYPHQLSGGMQQRVLIATALICDPSLVILDEPTTALDVTVEARVLDLLEQVRARRRLAMLFISHNLALVRRIADRIAVLYAGRIVESGTSAEVLDHPAHPYTKGLLACLPRLDAVRPRHLPAIAGRLPDLTRIHIGCIFAERCLFTEDRCRKEPQSLRPFSSGRAVRCWKAAELEGRGWETPAEATADRAEPAKVPPMRSIGGKRAEGHPLPASERRRGEVLVEELAKTYTIKGTGGRIVFHRRFGIPIPVFAERHVHAVDGVSFAVPSGEVLGLVGESGSGKSTLGRLVLRLIEPSSGRVRINGTDLAKLTGAPLRRFRGSAQIVFQNPDSSLNPRWTVGQAIERAVQLHRRLTIPERRAEVGRLLERVGLPGAYATRFPHQLSGGEKQRVGIARALATGPHFLVCDEPVSALDVSVQATVLNLLADLRDAYGLSYLFISHDLSVVAHFADRIAVMFAGRILEIGSTMAILEPPYHPYTEALLSAVRLPDAERAPPRTILRADADTAPPPRVGCPFQRRCPCKLGAICETEAPPAREAAAGHHIVCHIPLAELRALPPVLPR
jgi:peptide/nickel transport system ATP-binding protein